MYVIVQNELKDLNFNSPYYQKFPDLGLNISPDPTSQIPMWIRIQVQNPERIIPDLQHCIKGKQRDEAICDKSLSRHIV